MDYIAGTARAEAGCPGITARRSKPVAEITDLPKIGENMQATGEFEVNLQPLDPYATGSEGISLGRMSINKTFRGDLMA